MKATAEEFSYHQRLCARDDPIAFAELADWLYHPLVQEVRKRAGLHADAILVEEAVGEALLDYRETPEHYNPHRATLSSYLSMAAYRDFQNAQAKEQRVIEHQISLFDPHLTAWEISVEDQEEIESQIDAEHLWQVIDEVFPDPIERRVVTLILNNVHSPEPYAQLLHLNHLPGDEQLRQVRLVKYRITRRLRRRMTQLLQRTSTGGTSQ